MRNLTSFQLIAICLFLSVLPSVMALRNAIEAAKAVGLLPRDAVCGGMANYKQCGSNFPSAFCCPAGSTCYGLSNNASVVCCPKQDCSLINPLSCDPQFYNATAHPESPMHATNFNVQLAACGTNTCCAPGYSCTTNNLCSLNNNPTATASKASSAETATAARLTTATNIAAHSPTATTITPLPTTAGSNSNLPAPADCQAFPTNAILVGFFPGLVAGSLATFLFIICLGRCFKNKERNRPLKVSEPIYHEASAARTDFLRKTPKSNHSSGTIIDSTAPSTPLSRVRSLFSRTPSLSPRNWGSREHQIEPMTPPAQMKREPSTQPIPIYSPPDARLSRSTTFRDVMKAAGIHEPEPRPPQFMGSPGLVDPRSRGVDAGRLR